MDVLKRATELEEETIALRRWFHQHAELAWQEVETTEHIAAYLGALGLKVHRFEGHTGCWSEIRGGKATPTGKTILLRADIDALPMQEETGLPYASIHDGVFHACGHENHPAMLLTACKILTEITEQLPGTVRVLFQAAEETACGAAYYVDQGILDGVDAAYGCHIYSMCEGPGISVSPGPHNAATDEFSIEFQGVGCHGGMPHQGKDALVAACATVMNLQTVVSRMTDPIDTLVVTVGKIQSGSNYNVVANTASISGTVRSFDKTVRAGVPEKIKQVAKSTSAAFGCTASVEYINKTGAIVHDDRQMNRISHDAAVKLFGEDQTKEMRGRSSSDDFAYFSERVPGIYACLWAGLPDENGVLYSHHHPKVRFDERALKMGVAMHVQMAMDFLSDPE